MDLNVVTHSQATYETSILRKMEDSEREISGEGKKKEIGKL